MPGKIFALILEGGAVAQFRLQGVPPMPPHLLGLFRFYQSGEPEERKYYSARQLFQQFYAVRYRVPSLEPQLPVMAPRPVLETLPLGTSAIELAEIGIKLTLSETAEFKDIGLRAAFQVCTTLHDKEYIVSSYVALFAMFMHREEDMHELRAKRLIHGEFTNKQTLDFFTGRHAGNLRPGQDFYSILRRLERYKQRRWLWIAIHKFFYKNVKTIVVVLSINGALAGIFKALLLSIQKH